MMETKRYLEPAPQISEVDGQAGIIEVMGPETRQITEMEEDHEKFEQKLYEKKSEIMEMKSLMKEESSELKSKIRPFS